jgi:hypothetical protein
VEEGQAATIWGLIDAELVTFPVVAQELNAAIVTFSVPREAAEAALASDEFRVVDDGGGVDVVLALFEYRRGDWAPCNSLDIAFPVRPVGGGRRGLYMCPTLVSHPFNSEAAYWTMGVSRSVGDIRVTIEDDTVTFAARNPGCHATTIRLPRGEVPAPRQLWTTRAYTSIAGHGYEVPFEMELPSRPLDVSEVSITLGTGPLADTLRLLGLPAPATFASWAESLTGTFHQGQPVAEPTPPPAAPPAAAAPTEPADGRAPSASSPPH